MHFCIPDMQKYVLWSLLLPDILISRSEKTHGAETMKRMAIQVDAKTLDNITRFLYSMEETGRVLTQYHIKKAPKGTTDFQHVTAVATQAAAEAFVNKKNKNSRTYFYTWEHKP